MFLRFCQLVDLEYQAYWPDFPSKKINGQILTWFNVATGPEPVLQMISRTKLFNNGIGYSNAEVDSLINEADKAHDVSKAKDLYRRVLTLRAEGAPNVCLARWSDFYSVRDNIRIFAPVVDIVPRLRSIWLAK